MGEDKKRRLVGKEKLLNIMAARLCAYSFLKRAFIQEPNKEYLELLAEGEVMGFFPKSDNDMLKSGYENIEFYLRDPNLLTEESIIDLGSDYLALFIGPGKLGANPYESVYRSKKPLVFQEHTMQVRAEYAKYDLVPEKMQQEPDDHVGLELDFLLKLTERAMGEIRAGRYRMAKKLIGAQKDFLDDHLMKWVGKFVDEVTANAKTDFYRGAGKMLGGYLQVDQALVDGLLKEVNERAKQAKAKRLIKAV